MPDRLLRTAVGCSRPSPPRPTPPWVPASGKSRPTNDLYLLDRQEPLNVSREHFLIERDAAGYVLVDRQSTCGTVVEGETVGRENKGSTVALRDGDVIIVGTSASPFVFKFRVR